MQQDEDGVRIPGDPERESRRERGENGIPMAEALYTQITDIASRASAPVCSAEVGVVELI